MTGFSPRWEPPRGFPLQCNAEVPVSKPCVSMWVYPSEGSPFIAMLRFRSRYPAPLMDLWTGLFWNLPLWSSPSVHARLRKGVSGSRLLTQPSSGDTIRRGGGSSCDDFRNRKFTRESSKLSRLSGKLDSPEGRVQWLIYLLLIVITNVIISSLLFFILIFIII